MQINKSDKASAQLTCTKNNAENLTGAFIILKTFNITINTFYSTLKTHQISTHVS